MSDKSLHEWLGHVPAAAYTCDPSGLITGFNERAVKLWGSAPQAGSPAHRYFGACQLVSENGRPVSREEFCMARMLESGKDCSGCEVVFSRGDRQLVHVLVNASPIWDSLGRLTGGICIMVDMGAQHEARSKLQKEIDVCRKTEILIHESNDKQEHLFMHFLHEDIAQQLTGIALLGGILKKNLALEFHPLAPKAAELSKLTSECMTTASSLAKGFYPLDIEVGGLLTALESLAQRTETHLKIACVVHNDDSFRFAERDSIHIYRIIEIAILRAVQNFGAKKVLVDCRTEEGISSVSVSHFPGNLNRFPWSNSWVGLNLLNSRARLIGASIHIEDDSEICGSLVCRLREPAG